MTFPYLPPVNSPTPHVAYHEDAATVLSEHGGLHPDALQDGRGVAIDVCVAFLDVPLVHDIVVEHVEPRLPRHNRRSRLYEYQRKVVVQDPFNCGMVALVAAALKLVTRRSEVGVGVMVGHTSEDDTSVPPCGG